MSPNSKQRILVTGGTGFMGSHLAKRLLSKGHEVIIVDNQKGLFYDELLEMGAQITLGDITDRDLMFKLTEGCEVVHHLAAIFRKVALPKERFWDVNVNGTRYLLEAAEKFGVERFVYCSTCGVHGHIKHPPADENAPIAPEDYYQQTKYDGEEVAQEFIKKGLPVTILRPTAVYGPGDPGRWVMLFKQAAPGRFLMFGSGKATYHPCYIDNLVDAHELAAEKEEAIGQTYLVADEKYYELNDLVKAIGRALDIDVQIIHLPYFPLWLAALGFEILYLPLPKDPPIFRRRAAWFQMSRAFDISKAKRELGYDSKVDLDTGLAITAKWYQDNNYI